MQAYQLTTRGKSGAHLVETPRPSLGPNDVRLKMLAASINRVDLYMRDSGEGIRHTLPQTMGIDGVGEVIDCGAAVDLAPNQRVIIYPYDYCGTCRFCLAGDQTLCLSAKILGEHRDGTFSQEIVLPARSVVPISTDIPPEQVAALGVAYLTAWRMVFGKGTLTPGQTVLVQGAGGGVSYAAMQLAMMAGAKTIVTTSGSDKIAHFKSIGVDAIDYAKQDVVKEVMRKTNGDGADLVIDNSGEKSWPVSLRSLVRGGRLVTCGATTGGHPSAELQRMFIRQLSVHGSTMGNLEEFRRLVRAFEAGAFLPKIDSIFTLSQIAEAFERQENPDRIGKVIVRISEDT